MSKKLAFLIVFMASSPIAWGSPVDSCKSTFIPLGSSSFENAGHPPRKAPHEAVAIALGGPILRFLGKGGQAMVYIFDGDPLGPLCAGVKCTAKVMIPDTRMGDFSEIDLERALAEYSSMVRIQAGDHPGKQFINKPMALVMKDGSVISPGAAQTKIAPTQHVVLVLEYAEGQTLQSNIDDNIRRVEYLRTIVPLIAMAGHFHALRILKETEQLPDVKHRVLHPGKVLRFADQLSQALGAFEEGGIVHGDLKPSNIIVTLSGDIRIIDFGVAGKHGHPRDYLAGSYDYMSPDQWSYIKEHLQPGTPAKDYLLNHADDLHAARTLLEDALLAGIGFTRENLPEKYKIDFEKDSGIETPSPIYQLQTSVWNIYRDLAQRHGLVQPPTQERILKMLSTALHFRHYKGVSQFGEVLEQLKKADAAGSTDGFFEYFGKEVLGQVSPTIAANFIFSAPETITAWGQNKLGLSATQKSRILIAGQIFYGGKFPRPYGFEQFLARQYAQPFPGAISTAVDNSQ